MSKITTANVGYGFSWDMGNMPDRSILDIFDESELENFLDLDQNFNLDMDSYEIMPFIDFENMMNSALKRISGEAKPSVSMVIVGEREFEIVHRVVFVVRESITHAMLEEVVEVTPLEPVSDPLMERLVKDYFPGVEPKWILWGFTV
ncbi:MAG: hypothetical protein H9W81_04320 [Enterococcus sp.]|nr:hypothetical protein [Enterococcus sp.]